MRFQTKLLITGVFITAITMPVLGTYRTFYNQDTDAISLMNESELALLSKIQLIRKGMSYPEVRAILGYPVIEGEFNNQDSPTDWIVNNSYSNRVSLYFSNSNGVLKIRWRKYGYFTYEPIL